MRGSRWSVLLCLACLAAPAQIPPRAELTKAPKYLENAVKPAFRTFTEAQLRAEVQVIAARSHAMFGYNTPEVRIKLPRTGNSSYAQIEFGEATLLDAKGKPVAFELEEGGYEESKYSDEIRFRMKDSDGVLDFAKAKGHVKLKYPLSVRTSTFTKAKPGPAELAVKLDGPYVSYAEEEAKVPDTSFVTLRPERAYDAAGRQLERHGYSEAGTDDDGVYRRRTAYYGNVARFELDSVDDWAELDLAYDLKPAPMLPAGKEGIDPDYKP
jgi:hypothetical protein